MDKNIPSIIETCREWVDEPVYDRCGRKADAIIWGKLFPKEALGPRCRTHVEKHLPGSMLLPEALRQGWAVFDLRNLRRG